MTGCLNPIKLTTRLNKALKSEFNYNNELNEFRLRECETQPEIFGTESTGELQSRQMV
jgi:hypothetical protein